MPKSSVLTHGGQPVSGVEAIAVTHLTSALLYSHLMMTDCEPPQGTKGGEEFDGVSRGFRILLGGRRRTRQLKSRKQ